jgi:hypothetical protein
MAHPPPPVPPCTRTTARDSCTGPLIRREPHPAHGPYTARDSCFLLESRFLLLPLRGSVHVAPSHEIRDVTKRIDWTDGPTRDSSPLGPVLWRFVFTRARTSPVPLAALALRGLGVAREGAHWARAENRFWFFQCHASSLGLIIVPQTDTSITQATISSSRTIIAALK